MVCADQFTSGSTRVSECEVEGHTLYIFATPRATRQRSEIFGLSFVSVSRSSIID